MHKDGPSSTESLAPVCLFTFNRPRHVIDTISRLSRCPEAKYTKLIAFSDGPRRANDHANVAEVRRILASVVGFSSVTVIERQQNFGLARSIIDGVTSVLQAHPHAIILEDDLLVDPRFLTYMNYALSKYRSDDRIWCISGYVYPIDGLPDAFFLRGADCWGWATWSRAWKQASFDGPHLYRDLVTRRQSRTFDFRGSYPYTKMLRDQIAGKNNSWAIRWYASAFLRDKLCLYPGRSLVSNVGMDGTGTHCGPSMKGYETTEAPAGIPDLDSVPVEHCERAFELFCRHFASMKQPFIKRVARLIGKRIVPYKFRGLPRYE